LYTSTLKKPVSFYAYGVYTPEIFALPICPGPTAVVTVHPYNMIKFPEPSLL
jgi:hypothetical protein